MPALGRRAEHALATRRRMVHAAYDRFCKDGYPSTTMHAIAEEAEVAVQTLYYTFHTKAALLGEAIGAAIVGFDRWHEPPSDPDAELLLSLGWWADFEAAPTAAKALAVFITSGLPILERVGPLVEAMHGGSGDPDAAAVIRVAEERRVVAYREAVGVMAEKPDGLRAGLTQAAATDLLVVLFSAELYHALAVGRGWAPARCTTFFQHLLSSQLLQ